MTTCLPASAETASLVQRNWQKVRAEVAEACAAVGRSATDVEIIGVSKYVGPELTLQLAAAGCRALGENRPQLLWQKCEWLEQQPALPAINWHMIGHLQRNKVRRTLPRIEMLHSLDSLRLAQTVSQEASAAGLRIKTLIDVNVTRDPTKTGLPAQDLNSLVEQLLELPGIELQGLMAMSSLEGNSQTARREFAQLRELREQVAEQFRGRVHLPHLSMGMSGDFREAIAEGATLVRIGSSLWDGILGHD